MPVLRFLYKYLGKMNFLPVMVVKMIGYKPGAARTTTKIVWITTNKQSEKKANRKESRPRK